MYEKVSSHFRQLFHADPIVVQSPGRINIIGEHTDYNEGFVLPAAIDKKMYVAIGYNDDSEKVRLYAMDFVQEFEFSLRSFKAIPGHWANYAMGVCAQLIQKGYQLRGFDLVFGGDIPVGAGLSSSAALEAAIGFGIDTLFDLKLSKMDLITIAQQAEHEFAGVKCGIMDQFASVMGKKHHVILLDCRSLDYQYHSLSLDRHAFILVNSKVKHSLAESEYNDRRYECQEIMLLAKTLFPAVHTLRDLNMKQIPDLEPFIDRGILNRGRFVIAENERVLQAVDALSNKDLKLLGQLLYDSHEGLRHLYEVSCTELDFLVDFTKPLDYVLGSRMMGGGFGGCTINLVKKEKSEEFIKTIHRGYEKAFGIVPECYQVGVSDGTGF